MKIKVCFLVLLVLLINQSFSQSTENLLNNLKSEKEKQNKILLSGKGTKKINHIELENSKRKIFEIKKQLKKSKINFGTPLYFVNNFDLDNNLQLTDFYVYEYSENYYSVIGRVKNKKRKYLDWVRLTYNFYKNGQFVATDFTYIDYETYGSTGISPYKFSFFDTYSEKVDFDSVGFDISYDVEYGSDAILWDQILKLEAAIINIGENFNKWQGRIKNQSNYSVRYPMIIACILKDNKMIATDFTFLDVQDNFLAANTAGTFDSYIDLPNSYDEIKYYLSYALWSLEGEGNIAPNFPIFTELIYSGSERTTIPFDVFLIDHKDYTLDLMIDWGDGTPLGWTNSHISGFDASVPHSFPEPNIFYIKAKSKDQANFESGWSDSIKVEVAAVPDLMITTSQIKQAKYKNSYEDYIFVQGGIPPYQWMINEGALPNGLMLSQNNGKLYGAPQESGNYDFSITVTDAGLPPETATSQYTLFVENNKPIFISPNSTSVFEHQLFSYQAEANDPEGNVISYTFKNYPSWTVPQNSHITGTPPEGAPDSTFLVVASDGELSDSIVVTIEVIPVNDPPQIISKDSVLAFVDSVFSYKAEAIDPEGDSIIFSFLNYPTWLTVTNSTISGIPSNVTIDSSFLLLASDGQLNDSLLVTVSVVSGNVPPQITNIYDFSFLNTESFVIDLDNCVIDPEHQPEDLEWNVTSTEDNLKIDLQNHTVTFTAPNWMGTADVKFKVTDPFEDSDSLNVNVIVTAPSFVNNNKSEIPNDYSLKQNYPNPFNSETLIYFGLPKNENVIINIFNLNGELIEKLLNDKKQDGYHQITWNALKVPTGTYFIKMQAGEFSKVIKCILIK